jgi:DNA-binding GntR family transcriptional regulator
LTEIAATKIREAIINNDFKLGQPLSEAFLSKSMEISKTPVREALAKLKSEGLVVVVPHSGTYVFTMSLEDLIELLEYRYVLEVAALKDVYKNKYKELITNIDEITKSMDQALKNGNIKKYVSLDYVFHRSFFDLCDNRYLVEAYNSISAKIRSLQTRIAIKDTDRSASFKEHLEICKTIKNHDFEKLLSELNEHFERTVRSYKNCQDEIEVFYQKQK